MNLQRKKGNRKEVIASKKQKELRTEKAVSKRRIDCESEAQVKNSFSKYNLEGLGLSPKPDQGSSNIFRHDYQAEIA